ncbi:MAG: type IV pilus secretin PilQ [Deltaproteobacteria bacterium]|nr:type IV pilus secretin PilQ [Deltaproteobacteria bacterium]
MQRFDYRLRQGLLGFMLGGVIALTGCASTGPKEVKDAGQNQKEPQATAAVQENRIAVEYINVVGEGDRVLIGTTGSIKYTVFKLSDPSRLIVDMPGVNLEKVTSPVSVGNEFLNEITAVSYGENKDIGRVIISLKDGIDHEVKSGENSILVSLKKSGAVASEEKAESVVKTASASEPVQEQASEPQAAKEEPAVVEAPKAPVKAQAKESSPLAPAKKIVRVDNSVEGDNTIVKIVTDGAAENINSFDLENPARIVIDVPGVDNFIGKDVVKVSDKYIKTVRVGSHTDKARLVLDGSVKKLPPHSVKIVGDSIIVTLGPKVKPEPVVNKIYPKKAMENKAAHVQPEPEKAVSKAEAKPEAQPEVREAAVKQEVSAPVIEGNKIESIDFKKVAGTGRLTIVNSAKTEYVVQESQDGKTLVLDIKDTTIPDQLARTLDATKLKTLVATISSYQESVQPKAVRVLVKLQDKSAYIVKEDNKGTINIEFGPAPVTTEKAAFAVVEGPVDQTKAEGEKRYNGEKITLDMMDANISDVLRLLAEISNLNIIASDEVKGTISLRLKNVPWDQAFDIILKAKDLDSIREGNVVRVAPIAKIRQEKESTLASSKAQEKLESLETRFIPVSYANADELISHVKSVLSDRGTVTSEKRTSTLIVRDIKRGLEAADEIVKKLDKATPQVLIEARIVEASSSFARDLGIQWGLDYGTGGSVSTQTFGAQGTAGQVSTRAQTPNSNITVTGGDQYAVNLPASGTAGTLGALGFLLGTSGRNPLLLDLRLSAGESEGQLKTISRPRITTMDNKEAKIEQGESIPFETTSASGTSTTFIDANLSLTVTPHITPDGSVLMKIKASRNSVGTFRTSAGEPSINKKESSTEVLVKDGETTVIGGIVVTDKNESDKGIPYLKNIPGIGWLFKNKSVSDTQTELLIFITPTILKDKIQG